MAFLDNEEDTIDDGEQSDDDTKRLFSADDKEADREERDWSCVACVKGRARRDLLKVLLLVLGNGVYLYLGGICFHFLERDTSPPLNTTQHIHRLYQEFQQLQPANVSLSALDIERVEGVLQKILVERIQADKGDWNVAHSVFFASTVVTTIGYGNIAPSTGLGRLFCVVYAVVGIPLTLMLLTVVGSILSSYINSLTSVVVRTVQKYLYPDYVYESTEGLSELNVPVWLALVFLVVFIVADALVFMYIEGWSFPTSLYFVFITLTTIGFGDIVPVDNKVVWFNVTLLYIGLAAVSITINLIIVNIRLQYRKHKQKLKFVEKIERQLGEESTPLKSDFK